MSDESPEVSQERISVSPELGKRLAEAKTSVTNDMAATGAEVANGTEQMGLLASFGHLYKDMMVAKAKVAFKDVKLVLSALPFIPLLSKAAKGAEGGIKLISTVDKAVMAEAGVAKAQKVATKADRWAKWFKGSERAQQKLQKATAELGKATREASIATQTATFSLEAARGMSATATARNEGKVSQFVRKHLVHDIKATDYVMNYEKAMQGTRRLSEAEKILKAAGRELPARNFAEKVGKRAVTGAKLGVIHSIGGIIDPSPDVPGVVVLGSIGAELAGFPIAALVLPVWQYMYDRYESMKINWETAKKAKEILRSHFEKKMSKMKEPQVAKAVAIFA